MNVGEGQLAVISGASGFESAARGKSSSTMGVTSREVAAFAALRAEGAITPCIRAHGTVLGHGLEAHFAAGVALAALALRTERFYPPYDQSGVEEGHEGALDHVLVTAAGNVSGEGLALLRAAEA
jgi:3-oxoacyl-[acyl-carrier-protein] synthase II